MNLMTKNAKGWATIDHPIPGPAKVLLTSEESQNVPLELLPNDLELIGLAIINGKGLIREVYLPTCGKKVTLTLEIPLGKPIEITINWGKNKFCTFDLIEFLTQTTPHLVYRYLHPKNWNR